MLGGLRTVVYGVANLERARDWYAELLGHGPYFDQPFYVGFDVDGFELGLVPDEAPRGSGGVTPYWAVYDADAAVERLIAMGAAVREAVHDVGEGIRLGSVVDPFGNTLGVIRNPQFHGLGGKVAAVGADVSPRTVVHEAVVSQPIAEVWRRWTTSEGLAEWLVPHSRVDLRIGGAYEWYFDDGLPYGQKGGEGCVILSFLPQRMLSFTWNAPPGMATRERHTWVVVELEAAEGGTRIRLTHTGWPASGLKDQGTEWQATFDYFQAAWGQVMAAAQRSG